MRKITKQNLKELAKIMPVIDEKAQREYFGGSWYVNRHTGDEYGKVGTDDVIRTTDDFGYGKAKDDNSENEGMPLQGCDNWEKDIVFAAYAKRTIEYFRQGQGGGQLLRQTPHVCGQRRVVRQRANEFGLLGTSQRPDR